MFLISASSSGPEMYEVHAATKDERKAWMRLIREAVEMWVQVIIWSICVCVWCVWVRHQASVIVQVQVQHYIQIDIFSSHFSCHEKEEVTASESEEERSAAEAKNQRIQKLQGDALNKTDTNMV